MPSDLDRPSDKPRYASRVSKRGVLHHYAWDSPDFFVALCQLATPDTSEARVDYDGPTCAYCDRLVVVEGQS